MPRRRRRYRPSHQEMDVSPPYFIKGAAKQYSHAQNHQATLGINPLDKAMEYLKSKLAKAYYLLSSESSESEKDMQSKSLELANQMLSANLYHLEDIQSTLHQTYDLLCSSRLTTGQRLTSKYECTASRPLLRVSHDVSNSSFEAQSQAILLAALKATGLPDLQGTPAGKYEATSPAKAWADYICALFKYLPDEPLLITGTPINQLPPSPEDGELPKDENTGLIRRLVNNIFNRKNS